MAEIHVKCPKCHRYLVERTNRDTNDTFLACPGYMQRRWDGERACSFTQELPLHIRLRAAGNDPLPGF